VRDVSFSLQPGEVISLIGESGSGKSTIGKMILRLLSVNRGTISHDGTDISTLRGTALRAYYRTVQGVFQDPFSSFNPIFKADHVFGLIRGVYFGSASAAEWERRVDEALQAVTLDPGQVLGNTRTSSAAGSCSGCSSPGRCSSTRATSSPTRSSACSTPPPGSTC